jgi:hypothetical protein
MSDTTGTQIGEADLYGLLRTAIAAAGSQDAWARGAGLAPSFVSDTLAARRPLSDRILAALGVRKVTSYVLMNPTSDAEGAARLIKALSRGDRRTLLWLPESGAPRLRADRSSDYRPLLMDLRRLRALRLAVETPEGWSATEAGKVARAALLAAKEREGAANA